MAPFSTSNSYPLRSTSGNIGYHSSDAHHVQYVSFRLFRVHAGHVFKLGVSTRIFVLQGPPSDEEPESELTITELKELRAKREAVLNDMETGDDASRQKPAPTAENAAEVNGIDWGMGEDAYDENPTAENPFAVEIEGGMNENLYLDDPKKTLRGWFEREGYELEYKVIFTSLLY